jgi:hypothetical protein
LKNASSALSLLGISLRKTAVDLLTVDGTKLVAGLKANAGKRRRLVLKKHLNKKLFVDLISKVRKELGRMDFRLARGKI